MMTAIKTKVLILSLLFLTRLAEEEAAKWGVMEKNEVAILTDKNFDAFVQQYEWVFVKFFAPWCGHCKQMAPGYSELALEQKFAENGIPIAEVDATVQKELASRFNLSGYPTLKMFRRGFPLEYNGGREKKEIHEYITKKMGTKVNEIKTLEEFREINSAHLAGLYFCQTQDKETIEAFERFMLQFDDIPFAITHNPEIQKQIGATKKAAFYVIRNFDDGSKLSERDQAYTDVELSSEFKKHRYGFVMEQNKDTSKRISDEKKTTIYVFTNDKHDELAEAVRKVAPHHQEDFFFVISDMEDSDNQKLSEHFGITTNGHIRAMSFKGGKSQKYKILDQTAEGIEQWLDDYKNLKARQYFKTEPIPEINYGPVKKLVGANFSQEVMKSDKHVLVKLYAPWCGHCKKLEPIFEELARGLEVYDDLMLGKMDAVANEHPKAQVQGGYPTLLFYPKGRKQNPIKHEGENTISKLLVFLNRNIGRVHRLNEQSSEL